MGFYTLAAQKESEKILKISHRLEASSFLDELRVYFESRRYGVSGHFDH